MAINRAESEFTMMPGARMQLVDVRDFNDLQIRSRRWGEDWIDELRDLEGIDAYGGAPARSVAPSDS